MSSRSLITYPFSSNLFEEYIFWYDCPLISHLFRTHQQSEQSEPHKEMSSKSIGSGMGQVKVDSIEQSEPIDCNINAQIDIQTYQTEHTCIKSHEYPSTSIGTCRESSKSQHRNKVHFCKLIDPNNSCVEDANQNAIPSISSSSRSENESGVKSV